MTLDWQKVDVGMFAQFVSAHAYVFARDPSQVLPLAHNYASGGPVVDAADRRLKSSDWMQNPWIKLIDRPPLSSNPALMRTFEGHEGAIVAVGLSAEHFVICFCLRLPQAQVRGKPYCKGETNPLLSMTSGASTLATV